MRINDEKDIYNILPEEMRNDYTIGIHGFNSRDKYWTKDENGNPKVDENKTQQVKDSILAQGLKFPRGRMLLSTVRFGHLSEYISSRDTWGAGGVIIALPKVLRNKNGEEIFVGGPNERSSIAMEYGWDRNRQPTSLSEIILPEKDVLSPNFIIGTYTKDAEGIEVELNQNHIAFNHGIVVPDDYFSEKQSQIADIMLDRENAKTIIAETARQKKEYNKMKKVVSVTALGKRSYQHFGSKIAEKLKELLIKLKSKLLTKNISRNKNDEARNDQ